MNEEPTKDDGKENVTLKEGFTQVCVWPATVVGEDQIDEFVEHMTDQFGVEVQYLEEIVTGPGQGAPPGGRNDVFFAIRPEATAGFAVPRLSYGIRWVEDVLASDNGGAALYPSRVLDYRSWSA